MSVLDIISNPSNSKPYARRILNARSGPLADPLTANDPLEPAQIDAQSVQNLEIEDFLELNPDPIAIEKPKKTARPRANTVKISPEVDSVSAPLPVAAPKKKRSSGSRASKPVSDSAPAITLIKDQSAALTPLELSAASYLGSERSLTPSPAEPLPLSLLDNPKTLGSPQPRDAVDEADTVDRSEPKTPAPPSIKATRSPRLARGSAAAKPVKTGLAASFAPPSPALALTVSFAAMPSQEISEPAIAYPPTETSEVEPWDHGGVEGALASDPQTPSASIHNAPSALFEASSIVASSQALAETPNTLASFEAQLALESEASETPQSPARSQEPGEAQLSLPGLSLPSSPLNASPIIKKAPSSRAKSMARAARNSAVGMALAYAERLESLFNPVLFLGRNWSRLLLAALHLSAPLGAAWLISHWSAPVQQQFWSASASEQAISFVGLWIVCIFAWSLAWLVLGSLGMAGARAMGKFQEEGAKFLGPK